MKAQYPQALILLPRSSHRHTFIILHGRGSSADSFAPELLSTLVAPSFETETPTGTLQTLPSLFPHARFVFPTASRQRATAYNRSIINQWFDNWPHVPLNGKSEAPVDVATARRREDLQINGLRETIVFIHELLRKEITLVGGDARNVVLAGLSQGCTASLTALLLWEGEPLGAGAGMCGWLLFRSKIEKLLIDNIECHGGEGAFNPFKAGDSDEGEGISGKRVRSSIQLAAEYLRELLDLPAQPSNNLLLNQIPIFLGHGSKDWKVPIELGSEAQACLRAMGLNVS